MRKGFFTDPAFNAVVTASKGHSHKTGSDVVGKEPACKTCGLFRKCTKPLLPKDRTGVSSAQYLMVLPHPSHDEDSTQRPFSGDAADYVKEAFRRLGIDAENEKRVIWAYALHCPLPARHDASAPIKHCRPIWWNIALRANVKAVFLFGDIPIKSYMAHRNASLVDTDQTWRGHAIPDATLNAWVFPLLNPTIMLRQKDYDACHVIFRQDVASAWERRKLPMPQLPNIDKSVAVLHEPQALMRLKDILAKPPPVLAFDYETTGLKPQAAGHEIYSVGMATDPYAAFAFLLTPALRPLVRAILRHKHIGKVAHNMAFEDNWSNVILQTRVRNWLWDTMQAAHVLDNRPRYVGLKFQALLHFGVIDYASDVEPYLKAPEGNDNNLNTIRQAPPDLVLRYNAKDALLEMWLAIVQHIRFGKRHLIEKRFGPDATKFAQEFS